MKKLCFSDIYFFSRKNKCFYTKKIYDLKINFLSRNKFQINYVPINKISKYLKESVQVDLSFFISSSNYFFQKNVFDFLIQNNHNVKNIKIFNEKNKEIIFNRKINEKNKSYLLRSYLTDINYSYLNNVDLTRIEQYLFLMYLEFLDYFEYEGIYIPFQTELILDVKEKNNDVLNSFFNSEKIQNIKNGNFSTLDFLFLVSKIRKIDFKFALKRLYQEFYSFLNITDPFTGTFQILNFDDFYFKDEIILLQTITNKIKQKKDKLKKLNILETSKKAKLLETIALNNKDFFFREEEKEAIKKYFNFFLFEKNFNCLKISPNNLKKNNLISLYYLTFYNDYFFPIEDFFLTLYHLLNRDFLLENNQKTVIINPLLISRLFFDENVYYLDLKEIFNKFKHFIFNNDEEVFEFPFFPLLKIKNLSFKCPVCRKEEYTVDYDFVFCANKDCQFKFNRKNLSGQEIKIINIKDIIKGIHLPSVYLEDKNKRKKLYKIKEYAPFKYSFTLKSW